MSRPAFQRRHYIETAKQFHAILTDQITDMFARDATINLVHKMADTFAKDNPRFDRQRFMQACGLPETD